MGILLDMKLTSVYAQHLDSWLARLVIEPWAVHSSLANRTFVRCPPLSVLTSRSKPIASKPNPRAASSILISSEKNPLHPEHLGFHPFFPIRLPTLQVRHLPFVR